MSKQFNCHKCGYFLGNMERGKIHKGTIMFCPACWTKIDIAIKMAEIAASQGKDFAKGSDCKVVDDLMGMLGMK